MHIKVEDNDPLSNDVLIDQTVTVTLPTDAFNNILITYTITDLNLFKDAADHVAGKDGSSGETTTAVLQELSQPFELFNPKSNEINVQVTA